MIKDFLYLCRIYCNQHEIAEGTLSYRLFNNGSILRKLRNGNSITIRSYEKALQWLSDHWPENEKWPDFIVRPQSLTREGDIKKAS